MEWLANYKVWVVIAVVIAVSIAVGIGGTKLIPSATELKNWSMQEAIFYGFLVLSFATFIKS